MASARECRTLFDAQEMKMPRMHAGRFIDPLIISVCDRVVSSAAKQPSAIGDVAGGIIDAKTQSQL
jgi:hypothetical protein